MNFDTHSYPHTWALKGVTEGEALHRRWATGGAGLDEGILLLSLPNSWLYGESLCKTNGGDE